MIHPKTALANARFVSAINDELHKQSTRKSLHKHYRYTEYGIDLCPVCGVEVCIVGETTDGRLVGSCSDAFSVARWNDEGEAE